MVAMSRFVELDIEYVDERTGKKNSTHRKIEVPHYARVKSLRWTQGGE
jgi:hypothetical protein